MTISGSKSVKQSLKIIKKATNLGYNVFSKNIFVLGNLKNIVCVNLHSMIKLMLTFVNSGLRKTMIIMMLNIIPKHPKVGTNTPLTTRSNNSVEGDSILFSVSAYKVRKQNITRKSSNNLNTNHKVNHLLSSL